MLRRRPDDTFELRLIERAIVSVRPAGLSPERKEALRLRIMSSLEEQDAKSRLFAVAAPERWLAVPAGVGIAAMIFAAVKTADLNFGETSSDAARDEPVSRPYVAVPEWPDFEANKLVTMQEHGWIRLGPNATIGIEQGSTVSYSRDGESGTLFLGEGRVTAASLDEGMVIRGAGWSAALGPSSTAFVQSIGRVTLVHAYEGRVNVTNARGERFALLPGASHVMVEPETVGAIETGPATAELAPSFVPASSVAPPATGAPATQSPRRGRVPAADADPSALPPSSAVPNAAPPPHAPLPAQPASAPVPAAIPVLPNPRISGPLADALLPAGDIPPPFAPVAESPNPPPNEPAEPHGPGGGSTPPSNGNGNGSAGSGSGENPDGETGGNDSNGPSDAGSNGNANGHDAGGSNGNGNANGHDAGGSNGNGNAIGHNADGSNGNGNANGHNADGSNGNGNANGHNDDSSNGNGNANGHNADGSNGNGNANGHNADGSNGNGHEDDGSNGNGDADGHTDDGSIGNGNANGQDDDGSNANDNANGNNKPPKLK